jgi:hypothetical protein
MATSTVSTTEDELKVLHGLIKSTFGSRAGTEPASRAQVLAIIIGLKDFFPDRPDRLWALSKLLPPEYGQIGSTNELDKATASVLINWLYATEAGLDENTPVAPHAFRVLRELT